jgi:hypothetical protein
VDAEIVELFVSGIHRYEGRPANGPRSDESDASPRSITLRAGLGVVGDRYFGRRAHAHASVTVQAVEQLEALARELVVPVPTLRQTRRTILLRGLDVDAMRGEVLTLDTGDGPVRLRINRPANPCAWMDEVIVPGAFRGLSGRGGMRCEPLDDGVLRLGPVELMRTAPGARP